MEKPNGGKALNLSVICGGPKDTTKRDILNMALMVYSKALVKVSYRDRVLVPGTKEEANAQYQPKVVRNRMTILFRYLMSIGIQYTYNDFKYTGGYEGYWVDQPSPGWLMLSPLTASMAMLLMLTTLTCSYRMML